MKVKNEWIRNSGSVVLDDDNFLQQGAVRQAMFQSDITLFEKQLKYSEKK